mgnify:CR=1 FL=1
MIERVIILENVDPVIFYGVNDSNIQLLRTLFPKLRILARGLVVKAIGDEVEMALFEEKVNELIRYCAEYNLLNETIIIDIVKGNRPAVSSGDNVSIHCGDGSPLGARAENQHRLVKSVEETDVVCARVPAGSGKTYGAIARAVRALKNKEVKKIILSRPAVEAGEKLGFLPGDMKDKIDPYLQPLYDALQDMIPAARLKELMDNNIIQIAPLAFMRGRTLGEAVIILDEAQNTSTHQIKMFLTRMGLNAKTIVTGDMRQIDLPPSQRSGLAQALELLHDVPGMGNVQLSKKDSVRHNRDARIFLA